MAKRRRSSYDDYDYGWGDFPKSKPIKPADGIQSKTKKGAFGESWWAKRWIQVLESYGIGTRLQRGRSYARGGEGLCHAIAPGDVKAHVQGSPPRPHEMSIHLPEHSAAEADNGNDAMTPTAR